MVRITFASVKAEAQRKGYSLRHGGRLIRGYYLSKQGEPLQWGEKLTDILSLLARVGGGK